jgi:drug/metabolite transporter (DMT)-like permease
MDVHPAAFADFRRQRIGRRDGVGLGIEGVPKSRSRCRRGYAAARTSPHRSGRHLAAALHHGGSPPKAPKGQTAALARVVSGRRRHQRRHRSVGTRLRTLTPAKQSAPAWDASRTHHGASAAGTLLGRHRLDDQISVINPSIGIVVGTRSQTTTAWPCKPDWVSCAGRSVLLVPTSHGERVALTAFVTYAVLAGGNAVGVRFSNRELAPLWGAGLRFALAAALLVAVMVVLRLAFPWGRALVGSLLYGLFNFAGSFGLTYYGLVQVHAGFGQIVLALVPLATLLLAVLWRQERLGPAAVVGTLLALAGVAVISYSPLQQSVPLLSVLAVVGGAICFAQALVLVRRFPPVHPVTMNAIGMTTGAALLLAAALVAHEPIVLPRRPETWAAMAYLVVIGSVVVFLLYLVVLRYWAASRASYGFVIIPFVTLLLSAWLDNEPVGLGLVVGGLLILGGVYVGALRPGQAAPATANAKTDRG